MVSRFRESSRATATLAALLATVRTAGRTVLFPAFTVAAALAAMLVFPLRFLYSMGAGGVLVALSAAFVSLTLLPALLAVLGPRVNALGLRRWQVAMRRDAAHVQAGPWYRLSRAVMRGPAPVAAFAAVLLIVIGLPFLRIEFTGVDASVLPAEKSAKVVDEALRTEFPPGPTSPVLVVAGTGERGRRRRRTTRAGCGRRRRGRRGPPEQAGGYWIYDVVPERAGAVGAREGRRARRPRAGHAVPGAGRRRDGRLPRPADLAGRLPAARAGDPGHYDAAYPVRDDGFGRAAGEGALMNLLTVTAAFGLLVLIFQDGRLEGLLAYDSQGALEATQPVLLFCVAFGLSTDYGVFLLTRIKEARDGGARRARVGRRRARADGPDRHLRRAAVLHRDRRVRDLEVVFIKEVGVGTALAVLIDAFIVRALLVRR